MADSNPTPLPNIHVEDMMIKKVHRVRLDMTIHKAIGLLLENKISGAPVVDNLNKVITVISQTDLMKLAPKVGLNALISNCLDHLPKVIVCLHKSASFTEVYKTFLNHPIHRIIIVDNDHRLQGLVSRSNILRILYGDNASENLKNTNVPGMEEDKKKKAS
jgi:predicted transcriptional regulator